MPFREEAVQLLGGVLEIGIDYNRRIAGGVVDAGRNGSLVAEIASEPEAFPSGSRCGLHS